VSRPRALSPCEPAASRLRAPLLQPHAHGVIPPRALLLRPLAIAAIAVLALNDHWLKAHYPGLVTGKLSDLAGLTFFPLLVVIAVDTVAGAWGRPLPRTQRTVALAALVTATGFALVKLAPPATAAFRWGLGALQWPAQAVWAALHGLPAHGVVEVAAVTDPTDLLALPSVVLAVLIARRAGWSAAPRRSSCPAQGL